MKTRLFYLFFSLLILISCSKKEKFTFLSLGREVPAFSSDSAFVFIENQIEFGPRVPGTEAHLLAKDALVAQLRTYLGARNVGVQRFKQVVYGDTLSFFNIIASINPAQKDRIALFAHWDSRPRADEASTEELKKKPVLGADDGASGVAVLLEIARISSMHPTPIGVDIILVDGEDYGKKDNLDFYFIGTRQWAQKPPVPNYKPRFGILLDMVGAKEAQFPKEKLSHDKAPYLVDEIWKVAGEIGFGDIFLNQSGAPVADDHYILNTYTSFSTIDIINHKVKFNGNAEFPKHWHTEFDDIHQIDKKTLHAVGTVLLELIYNRIQ